MSNEWWDQRPPTLRDVHDAAQFKAERDRARDLAVKLEAQLAAVEVVTDDLSQCPCMLHQACARRLRAALNDGANT